MTVADFFLLFSTISNFSEDGCAQPPFGKSDNASIITFSPVPGPFERSGGVPERSWGVPGGLLGSLGASRGPLGELLGCSWGVPGPPGVVLGASWGRLGALLGRSFLKFNF